MLDRKYIRDFSDESIKDGTLERYIRLVRGEEARQRALYKRDTLNFVLDGFWIVLTFPFELLWTIILMPLIVLMQELRKAIKGGE